VLGLVSRGHTLVLLVAAMASLGAGAATPASARLVVRRLPPPPEAAASARAGADRAATAQRPASAGTATPRVRAVPPAAIVPAGPGAGPAAWRQEQDVRAQRSRALPHFLSPPGMDWSPRANPRMLRKSLPIPRNPHLARGAAPEEAQGSPALTLKVAFIRVGFRNDRGGPLSSGDGRFDLSGPDTTVASIDRPPHNRTFYLAHLEALRRYYDVQTYGRVAIEGDVWPRDEDAVYLLNDMADYGPWAFSQDIYPAARDLFRDAFVNADTLSQSAFGDRIPWDDYDAFMIIHAGSDLQSDLRQDSPEDIPTFTIGVAPEDYVVLPGMQYVVDRAIICPETASQDGFYGALNGVIAHEMGHLLFGFADLYDVFTGRPVVGFWSLMDSGNLVGAPFQLPDGSESFAVGLLPPSVDPFHRFYMNFTASGVVDFTEVAPGDTVTIADSARHPELKRLFLSSEEYLVIENRAIAATDSVPLDQDPMTRVVLGPEFPDRFEYDGLLPSRPHAEGDPALPSGGLLVWHIDATRIPFETALRIDPDRDYGFNTDPAHPAISVIEADGLGDLGDGSSPFLFGSPYDPFFRSSNRTLSDTSVPNLRPHTGSYPHMRIDVLDEPDTLMRFSMFQDWRLEGWPVAADVPPGGPLLLAVDADGAANRQLEICWAGGANGSPDSASLFAVRRDGMGMFGGPHAFASLDRRPRPLMAALPIGEALGDPQDGPSYFAASTFYDAGADTVGGTPGGKVWLLDHFGNPRPGWPAALPSAVTTPPVISGLYPNASVFVGCADGRVYRLGLDGISSWSSTPALIGGVSGRLAVWRDPSTGNALIAAGGANGDVAVFTDALSAWPPGGLSLWPQKLWPESGVVVPAGPGFAPDFLWIDFDGSGRPAGSGSTCGAGVPALVVRHERRLWAFCPSGASLPGWGGAQSDTLVAGLGAGDPDGDGYAEVLVQTVGSQVAFINQSGAPSPGWPRRTTREGFRTDSAPLALDVDGDAAPEVVTLDASGLLAALRGDGRVASGWPLETGVGVNGAPVAADLERDGRMEIVAPDRSVPDSARFDINGRFGTLYAFSLPPRPPSPVLTAWPMMGGDPGRTSALPSARSPSAPPPSVGPLIGGSLRAFPNPARRRPVSFAYQLSEPADVDFIILDAAGHEVASFTRPGRRADNLEIWDPGRVPAGLYVARLRFRSATATHSEVITLGLLR
jgi:M6 family metalloprotease-like protein